MKDLRQMIKITSKRMKNKLAQAKITFYRSEGKWCGFWFWLEYNHTITPEDRKVLESIKCNDPRAIVIDNGDFIKSDGDDFILVDDMADSALYLYTKGLAKLKDFLEVYEMKEPQQVIKRGLQVGQKIKVGREVNKTWGKTYVVTVNQGVVTGLYPHIFTAELKANKNTAEGNKNIIRTSFLYSQLINGEVELWN